MKAEQLFALLPIIFLAVTTLAVMLLIAWRRHHNATGTVTVVGLNLALLATLAVFASLPFGMTPYGPQQLGIGVTPLLVIDGFACFYTALLIVIALACSTLSHAYLEGYKHNREELYLLLVIATLGGVVLVSSQHMAAFFIGLELLSVPVYGMVAYNFRQSRSLEAGVKYIVLSATASATLLFGMALMYAASGKLSFMQLAQSFMAPEGASPLLLVGTALVLAGVAFKLSVAPFHAWTADVYEGAPAPVGAFLATASKVAVFAVVIRFFYESGAIANPILRDTLVVLAGASMIVGNLLAVQQTNIKRLLGYSSIAHFGYLLVPLLSGAMPEAMTIYLVAYVVTSLGAFGVVTLMSSPYQGQDADQLHSYRGLFWRRPYLTAVMTVMMLSLAGIPITAGFIGKFYVIAVGVSAKQWLLLALLVIGSAISLYYYLRVMVTMFLAEPGMARFDAPMHWGIKAGGVMLILLSIVMFIIGVFPQPLMSVVQFANFGMR